MAEQNIKKLGELCDFVRGPFGGSLKKNCFKEEGFAVYEQQHAIYDQFNEIRYFIDKEKFEEMKRFELKSGDLIMSCSGTMGKVAIVPEGVKKGIINQALLKLTPNRNLNVEYLRYWMQSPSFTQGLEKHTVGAAIKNVASVKILKTIELPAPELTEQKQIVAILDEAFAAIDQAKANIQTNIQNAKELFQSKLNEIFSQKGECWEEKRLQDISLDFGRGKSKHRPRNDKKLYGGNYPFVQTGDIRNADKLVTTFTQSYNEVGLAQSKLWPKNTICITIAANIAETAIIDFDACFPDSIIGVVVDPKKASLDFTYYTLQFLKSELQAKGKGSAQDNINMGTFKDQFFPLPDIAVQESIVKELDSLKEYTNSLIETLEKKLIGVEQLKKSILQKAFAGELSEPMIIND